MTSLSGEEFLQILSKVRKANAPREREILTLANRHAML